MQPMTIGDLFNYANNDDICPKVMILDLDTMRLCEGILDISFSGETVIATLSNADFDVKTSDTYNLEWIAYRV